jgi:hypothetical protein
MEHYINIFAFEHIYKLTVCLIEKILSAAGDPEQTEFQVEILGP